MLKNKKILWTIHWDKISGISKIGNTSNSILANDVTPVLNTTNDKHYDNPSQENFISIILPDQAAISLLIQDFFILPDKGTITIKGHERVSDVEASDSLRLAKEITCTNPTVIYYRSIFCWYHGSSSSIVSPKNWYFLISGSIIRIENTRYNEDGTKAGVDVLEYSNESGKTTII